MGLAQIKLKVGNFANKNFFYKTQNLINIFSKKRNSKPYKTTAIPISVFIIAKNEEDRIGLAIEAVKKFADEILVIDSGSSDETVKIAQNLGAKTFYNKWQGYGKQKVFGESLCKNQWILNIDADEEVLDNLADEICELFSKKNTSFVGYKIKIVNKFFGEKFPKKWAYNYNQLRLYNKNYCGFSTSSVHDSVLLKNQQMPDKIGQLKNIIAHQSFRSIEHWLEKINSYSSMQAEDAFKKGKKATILKILITPTLAFLKAYFVRRYFIYGFQGIIYSYIFAFGRFIKLIKIRQKYL